MWRIYLKNNEGIAIESTPERLVDSMRNSPDDIHIGKVKYKDYSTDMEPFGKTPYMFMNKRMAFEYERELRAVTEISGQVAVEGIAVPIELNRLIKTIHTSYLALGWFHGLVKAVASRYGIEAPVIPSSLSEKPLTIV
jgi:hypothetical protein